MTREITNKLLELVDEGMLDARDVLLAALKYMSEDEVADMADCNGFIEDEEVQEEFEFEDDDEVNDAFEESHPDLDWSDLPAVREAFSFYVDMLQRDGRISDDLADSVTLRNDD